MMEKPDCKVISKELLYNYFNNMINRIFKILPLKENESDSVIKYIARLKSELLCCTHIVNAINNDSNYMRLILILQHLDNEPDCEIEDVRHSVFEAIDICERLRNKYGLEDFWNCE